MKVDILGTPIFMLIYIHQEISNKEKKCTNIVYRIYNSNVNSSKDYDLDFLLIKNKSVTFRVIYFIHNIHINYTYIKHFIQTYKKIVA